MIDYSAPVSVFVIDLIRGYGSERYSIQLVNALASTEMSVDLVCQNKGDTLVHDLDPNVRCLEIGSTNPFKTILYLYRYLKRTKPSAFFTMMEKPSLLGIVAGFLAGYRKVVPTSHLDIDAYASLEHGARRKLLRVLIGFFYRMAPAIIAVSTGVKATLQRWVGTKKKIITIHNGFNLTYLRQRAKENVDFNWLNQKNVPVVIACGRFVPLKGFDVLIKSFAQVRAYVPARLIILGDGEQRNELKKLIDDLGLKDDVAMPGYVDNPQAWFSKSDVFVLPSRAEGFGNVLVEALASGVKVVSTNCPSGPHEILQEGRLGALVPVGDVQALASTLRKALEEPQGLAEQMSIQTSLEERFSLSVMTKQYMELIEGLS